MAENRSNLGKKRPKPRLSCNMCRAKKLRCDHENPCNNCKSKPPGTCVYFNNNEASSAANLTENHSTRIRKRASPEDRLERLERLAATISASLNIDSDEAERSTTASTEKVQNGPPQLRSEGEETWLLSSSHWEAMSSEIANIKAELRLRKAAAIDNIYSKRRTGDPGPHLLLTCSRDISLSEILCTVPPRATVETLLKSFRNDIDNVSLSSVIHFPTFEKECQAFWKEPGTVSLAWLAQFYAALALGVECYVRNGYSIQVSASPEDALHTYTLRAAQCLVKSNYMRPAKYTIEAMILYLACEHARDATDRYWAYLNLNVVIRLAMVMGYHRDPRHYSMSVLESEMRRRRWSFLTSMDTILSAKCGLPGAIEERQTDTLPPSNFSDEDLNSEMLTPPVPRPDSEPTILGFLRFKSRILSLSSRLSNYINVPTEVSYEEILELDKDLEHQILSRPKWLDYIPSSERSVANPPVSEYRLQQQIAIDLVIQQACMVLHRKYLIPARTIPRFAYSRTVCLKAATRVLQHHGEFASHDWRFFSLMHHIFLLASILVGLDVEYDYRAHAALQSRNEEDNPPGLNKKELEREAWEKIQLIQRSHRAWASIREDHQDSDKVASVLEILLEKLLEKHQRHFPQSPADLSSRTTPSTSQPSTVSYGENDQLGQDVSFSNTVPVDNLAGPFMQTHEFPSDFSSDQVNLDNSMAENFSDIEFMFGNTSMEIDWATFDARYLGSQSSI